MKGKKKAKTNGKAGTKNQSNQFRSDLMMPICTICFNCVNKEAATLECGHKFHLPCFEQWRVEQNVLVNCPNCRMNSQYVITDKGVIVVD